MTNIPTTGELFATNQVSPDTERCYKYQLRNFANWMADSRDVRDMESVSVSDLLAYRQSIQHLAASSQNRYLAALKSFFAWALDTGMISAKSNQDHDPSAADANRCLFRRTSFQPRAACFHCARLFDPKQHATYSVCFSVTNNPPPIIFRKRLRCSQLHLYPHIYFALRFMHTLAVKLRIWYL